MEVLAVEASVEGMLLGADHGADGDVALQFQDAAFERYAVGNTGCKVIPVGSIFNIFPIKRKNSAVVVQTKRPINIAVYAVFIKKTKDGFGIVRNICALLTKVVGLIILI